MITQADIEFLRSELLRLEAEVRGLNDGITEPVEIQRGGDGSSSSWPGYYEWIGRIYWYTGIGEDEMEGTETLKLENVWFRVNRRTGAVGWTGTAPTEDDRRQWYYCKVGVALGTTPETYGHTGLYPGVIHVPTW